MAWLVHGARWQRDIDRPLLQISQRDRLTIRQAFEGIHGFGNPGSGKTTGLGRAVARAFLREEFGGVVCCAKPEEVERWITHVRESGRIASLVLFDETQGFNFIDYELARQGVAGISNVTECLIRVLEASDHATGQSNNTSDSFWQQAVRQLLNYTIPAIYCAYGRASVAAILDFVGSAATKGSQYTDEEFRKNSSAARTLERAASNPSVKLDARTLEAILDYWINQYPAIPEKTRGNIVISLSTKLDRFRHGRLRRTFCERTTIVPEMTFHGAVIILAMPVLTWNEDGVIGQQLFKFVWQRAVESRNGLDPIHRERPVFLFADESQYFASIRDDDFLSTCRGSRACVVYMTQTLPTYYAKFGRDKQDAADGLVGKFSTVVFHQSACPVTTGYASRLIGRGLFYRHSGNEGGNSSHSHGMTVGSGSGTSTSRNAGHSSVEGGRGSWSSGWSRGTSTNESVGQSVNYSSGQSWSAGWSEQMDNLVEPNFFSTRLLTRGPANDNIVTALWFRAGARFAAARGASYMVVRFKQ